MTIGGFETFAAIICRGFRVLERDVSRNLDSVLARSACFFRRVFVLRLAWIVVIAAVVITTALITLPVIGIYARLRSLNTLAVATRCGHWLRDRVSVAVSGQHIMRLVEPAD